MAPSREYLLALAQPAISVPRMPTAVTARTKTALAGTSAATTSGLSGITAMATR